VGAADQLRVGDRREQDRVVVRMSGELDVASAPLLQSELESPEIGATPLLVFDLEDLNFVDSTGLRIILLAHERARERGQEFAITQGSPQVQRLLNITSADEHLRIIALQDELPG
jgi:anti-sigma B factor antagonist